MKRLRNKYKLPFAKLSKTQNRHADNKLEKQLEQMALQELEEDRRQRVASAKKDETNLMDNRSQFNHRSDEIILLIDRGSDRDQQIVQDWVKSFPPSNSLIAASEINFSHRGTETTDNPVQGIAVYNSPENSNNSPVILRKT